MRIAIVSDYYLDAVGGAQSSMLEQQASLEEAGHTVLLVAASRGGKRIERDERGIRVRPSVRVPALGFRVIPVRPELEAELKSFFSDEKIDIVHVETEFGLAQAATNAAYLLQIPVVHTVHTFYWQSRGAWPTLMEPLMRIQLRRALRIPIGDTPFSQRPSDSLLRNVTLEMAKRADVVVSPSAHQGKDLSSAGVERPIGIVPNPVARATTPALELTIEQSAAPRILWVARFEAEKRPLDFIEAALLALSEVTFEIDLVGTGSELREAKKLVAGNPHFHFHGMLPRDRVIELVDAAAVVAVTSVGSDNQPMTIAEAVSRYRAILYCDSKLSEGLANSGQLARTSDAEGLSRAIVELIGDPALLLSLSAGAKKNAVTFLGSTYVERVLDVYAKATVEAH